MAEKITISTIAKEAGVSKTTISRYLNGNYGYMSEATRVEIAKIIEKYDYVPSGIARTLKSKKSKLIGIVVNTMRHNVASKTVMGMQEVLEHSDYATIVCCSNDDPAAEDSAIQMCLNQQVDGIIIIPCRNEAEKYQALYDRGIPMVLCMRRVEDWKHGCVYVRHEPLIHAMLLHLREQGFEKARFFLDVDSVGDSFHKRRMGQEFARLAAEYFGMNAQESVVLVGRDEDRIHRALDEYLTAYPGQRKALMAVNTHTLFLTLEYLTKHSVKIPDELGVCGYDALGWSELVAPGISAIRQPMHRMGVAAGEEMMTALREQKSCEREIALDGETFFRASTILK